MLNGSPLNAVALNGAGGIGAPEAVTIDPVVSVLWDVRLMLGGVDISANLTGQISIEREEGAATLAGFVISLDSGPVNPASYIGQSVQIFYRHWQSGAWVEYLRFVGHIIRPQYNMQDRLLICDCSDRLQDAIEALTVADVDSLTGGLWSSDAFEEPEGRSRWDYAQERMSTTPASLQKDVDGTLQVTQWAAGFPAYVFPSGSVLDLSMEWTPTELGERVNVVELEVEYRFDKLRDLRSSVTWGHPDVSSGTSEGAFCDWHTETSDLPDVSMALQAAGGSGFKPIESMSTWLRLPGTGTYCSPPVGFVNTYTDLLLGFSVATAMRFAQPITERYSLRVESPASIVQAGEVIRRDSISAETESDRTQTFLDEDFTGTSSVGFIEPDAYEDALGYLVSDVRDQDRLDQVVAVGVSMARVQILAAHRENRLSFQLPTADTLGVRLEHTLRVEDLVAGQNVRCVAKLFGIVDEWDFDSGAAITSLLMAVSQGGGMDDDPVVTPPAPGSTPPVDVGGGFPVTSSLPSHIAGDVGSPPYDEEWLGFTGNYDNYNATVDRYPRRLKVESYEIPASHRDEFVASQSATYRVAIPNDLLEL